MSKSATCSRSSNLVAGLVSRPLSKGLAPWLLLTLAVDPCPTGKGSAQREVGHQFGAWQSQEGSTGQQQLARARAASYDDLVASRHEV